MCSEPCGKSYRAFHVDAAAKTIKYLHTSWGAFWPALLFPTPNPMKENSLMLDVLQKKPPAWLALFLLVALIMLRETSHMSAALISLNLGNVCLEGEGENASECRRREKSLHSDEAQLNSLHLLLLLFSILLQPNRTESIAATLVRKHACRRTKRSGCSQCGVSVGHLILF